MSHTDNAECLGLFLISDASGARILCFKFSLNPLRFLLMRESNTIITEAKSLVIANNVEKIAIWQLVIIGDLLRFIIQELKFCKLLSFWL